jgi:hypothetical protein
MNAITDAYMTWSARSHQQGFESWAMPPASSDDRATPLASSEDALSSISIKVIDLFGGSSPPAALILTGLQSQEIAPLTSPVPMNSLRAPSSDTA